jgi:DNA-binding beta-propeller fold protein YncE
VTLGQARAFDLFGAFANLLVSRVSAKGEEGIFTEKRAAISPDGSRLYYVHSNESGNEIWAFDTANLKLVGRWAAGKGIVALQTSKDGGELYAVSAREGALYVLDALTGKVNRAFPKLFASPYSFAP